MDINQRADQQVLLYQSRLKHLDELIDKARKGLDGHPEKEKHEKTLADILQQRDELQVKLDDLVQKNPDDLEKTMEKEGLMSIWDVLARDLEKLLEKLGL